MAYATIDFQPSQRPFLIDFHLLMNNSFRSMNFLSRTEEEIQFTTPKSPELSPDLKTLETILDDLIPKQLELKFSSERFFAF